jgi:GLPGLI family protein
MNHPIMKPLLSTLFYLISFINATSAQQGRISYELRNNNIQQKNSRQVIMLFSRNEYVYETMVSAPIEQNQANNGGLAKEKLKNDSIEETKPQIQGPIGTPTQQWYGNLRDNVVIYSTYDNNLKVYCVRDTIDVIKWELLKDTATIRGISCQKAYGTFKDAKYTGWFAYGIPTAAAPLQFRGLPGLMIEVTNTTNGSTLSMLHLEWPVASGNTEKIEPCSTGPLLSKQEFAVIRDKQNARAIELMEQIQAQK